MPGSLLPTLVCPIMANQKLIVFHLLVKFRFKEIKITYPSASDTDFSFIQYSIKNIEILDDV
ncbi:hypothetical protein BDR06DRAFT_885014 [Suillus hirtellus]|nr:hypothetical protein BDR06DRAFT_885014 [Suillus hirtellus]